MPALWWWFPGPRLAQNMGLAGPQVSLSLDLSLTGLHFDTYCFSDICALWRKWNEPDVQGDGRCNMLKVFVHPCQTASQFKVQQTNYLNFTALVPLLTYSPSPPHSSPSAGLLAEEGSLPLQWASGAKGREHTRSSPVCLSVPTHCWAVLTSPHSFPRLALLLALLTSSSLGHSASVGLLSGFLVVASCHWLLKPKACFVVVKCDSFVTKTGSCSCRRIRCFWSFPWLLSWMHFLYWWEIYFSEVTSALRVTFR